ncbi:MAG: tyrosine--tRNA ligase [Candidatus Levybacteria bacterium]|nr:tyrosine--tRNA ligase [Candidatus Levybacteria bacterium]
MDKIEELLTRGVANIIPNKEKLKNLLRSGKKLNVYLGIDPTATKIHLGHAVSLRKLQAFAELGHSVTFLIGDFTALIGDTSDKDSERPVLTSEQIEENFKTYKKQAEKILDFSKVSIKYNSEWLQKLPLSEFIKIAHRFSFGDFASRELIKKRLSESKRVGLHEALYPALQGYDSYYLDTDVQIGGTDQTFNMQAGRTLQKDLQSKESFIIATEFLMGTDGRKMSKTWNNAIWITDEANDMYAKVMAINDDLIVQYYMLATNVPMSKVSEVEKKLKAGENPMNIKKQLAHELIRELYSAKVAKTTQEYFEKTVQQKELPDNIKIFEFGAEAFDSGRWIEDILIQTKLVESRSEAKRLVVQGGVEVNNKKVLNPEQIMPVDNMLIKVGKRKFAKIKVQTAPK